MRGKCPTSHAASTGRTREKALPSCESGGFGWATIPALAFPRALRQLPPMLCHTLATAHAAVCQLVHDFAANEAYYLSPGYPEAQARISFIDKLWQALGWDVAHENQKNPFQQEVKVEDPQKIGGHSRRADYAFHTHPNFRDARFFCEAKKPSVQLKTDADAAFQTLRYGWNAGTPLAVLTDFEQLHILDCRAKPNVDTALSRSIINLHDSISAFVASANC